MSSTTGRNWLTINSPILAVAALSAVASAAAWGWRRRANSKKRQQQDNNVTSAHERLILNGTPLVKLEILSGLLGRNIYGKMENLNPGGTGKDRAALSMIRRAEREGSLPSPLPLCDVRNDLHFRPAIEASKVDSIEKGDPSTSENNSGGNLSAEKMREMITEAMKRSRTGGLVVEGTSGSTGIALATLCVARGHGCLVVLPDDQAKEKQTILRSLGAVVYKVPTAAISNPNHYVNLARKAVFVARDTMGIDAVFTDQFENDANFEIHYSQTGPEIWRQLRGKIGAFVMSSGTGGTIAGVGSYLKERNESTQIILVDPPGSALHHKVEYGVAYAVEQQERTLRKHRYDTLAEGIGLDRVTQNFALGLDNIDRSIRVLDQEAVDMAHFMLRTEGLWMGSSSAMNLVGAVRSARDLPPGSNVVTMICDTGQRHTTRFWNPSFVEEWGLKWPDVGTIPNCLSGIL